MWLDLGRDLALFVGALITYRYQAERAVAEKVPEALRMGR